MSSTGAATLDPSGCFAGMPSSRSHSQQVRYLVVPCQRLQSVTTCAVRLACSLLRRSPKRARPRLPPCVHSHLSHPAQRIPGRASVPSQATHPGLCGGRRGLPAVGRSSAPCLITQVPESVIQRSLLGRCRHVRGMSARQLPQLAEHTARHGEPKGRHRSTTYTILVEEICSGLGVVPFS